MLKKIFLLVAASFFLLLIAYASANSAQKEEISGCLAGSGIGKCISEQTEVEADALAHAKYCYGENCPIFVRLDEVKVSPRKVPPGGKIEIIAAYTILGMPGKSVDVVECRELMRSGKVLGGPKTEIERSGGAYISRVPVVFPTTAARGTYMIRVTIKSGPSGDAKETSFIID